MKKKTNKRNSDFFTHAKEVMGEDRYEAAVRKGRFEANSLRLQIARKKLGLNQTELKGMTQPEVSKIEARKDLKVSTLKKYAEAMGMKVKISLVDEDEDESKSIAIYG